MCFSFCLSVWILFINSCMFSFLRLRLCPYLRLCPVPVTLPAQLPDPHHQSCRSLPLHSFCTGLKPLLPISWIMDLLHTSTHCCVCVCVSVWVMRNSERKRGVTWSLDILSALPLLRSSWRDVWQTGEHTWSPVAPCAHRRTHKHTHSQLCSNASRKALELRGEPLWCLFYRAVRCWQLHIMETNWGPEFGASPDVLDGCFIMLTG